MSETTPLLAGSDNELARPQDVYDRFSNVQKRVILIMISVAGLISRKYQDPQFISSWSRSHEEVRAHFE
jgi:hypothetical protein